jgi:serine protease Do
MVATPDLDASGIVTIGRDGRGTGFVLRTGRVVTNSHHLRDRTTQVGFAAGRSTQGRVVGVDPDGDLAVLDVETGDAPAAVFATTPPALGDQVRALGRAGASARVTAGHVSAIGQTFRGPRGRTVEGAVEHTAPLPRGATGGPVVNDAGEVIAITTLRLPDGFAIARPTDAALQERLAQLAAGESVRRRTIGVVIAPSEVANKLRRSVGLPERDGLLVRGVRDGSPAAHGGLQVGDLIVAVDGTAVATPEALAAAVEDGPDGRVLRVSVVRGADEHVLEVTLAEEAAEEAAES